jgi:hypothetical protein
VPLSDENVVIIPSNVKGTGFLKNKYKENRPYIGGLITKDDFNTIIEGCAKITAMVYSHNRKKDVEGIRPAVIVALAISTMMLFCFIFLLYYGIRDDNENERIAGFFMLGVSVFITSVIGLINFFSRPDKYTPFKEMVRKALLKYFVNINKEYGARGLEWDVRDNHYWIEVKINRSKADTYRKRIEWDPNIASDSEEDQGAQENEVMRVGEGVEGGGEGPNTQGEALATGNRDGDDVD